MLFVVKRLAVLVFLLTTLPCWAGPVGAPIQLNVFNDGAHLGVAACYNPYSDQHLVLWSDVAQDVLGYGWQLKGRRVDPATGTALGSPFYISPDPATIGAITGNATYNSSNHEWLVVYQGDLRAGNNNDVLAQRIASDGTKIGGYIPLVARAGSQNAGRAAFDPANNRYLVVWLENDFVYGRLFDQTGSPIGSQVQIRDAGAPYYSFAPYVAYNPVYQEFMVIWQDYRNYIGTGQDNDYSDIYGQRVNASTGAKIGTNIAIYWGGSPYVINLQDIPQGLVVNPTDGRYFIPYNKLTSTEYYRTYGLIINQDGSWYGPGTFPVSPPDYGVPTGSGYDPTDNSYFSSYEDLTNANIIRGRKFAANSNPIGAVHSVNSTAGGIRGGDLAIRTVDGQLMSLMCADSSGALYAQRYLVGADTQAPANANPFRAYQKTSTSVLLTWAHPLDADVSGTMVRYRTDGYPTSVSDGTLVCNKTGIAGASDSFTHTVTPGLSYYYTALTYDGVPNYSPGVNATPSNVWLYDSFDTYPSGSLDPQGGWVRASGKKSCVVQNTVRTGTSGNALELLGTDVYDDSTITNFGAINEGYHKVSFDMRRNASASGNQAFIGLYHGALIISRVYWSTSFSILTGAPGAVFTDLVTSPVSGQWYHIEIGVDATNRTLDAWVDGVQKITAKPYYQAATQIDSINLTGYSAAVAASYLDNLKGERGALPPSAPVITRPPSGSTVQTASPRIEWSGETHDMYEVHVNTSNNPADGSAYDSGQVSSPGFSQVAGPLINGAYYVFVRLHNSFGWGDWSAAGHTMTIAWNTSPPAPATDFAALGRTGVIDLSWRNPLDPYYDLASVIVCFRADRYPVSVEDGMVATTVTNPTPGALATFAHSGLTNGIRYYYSLFARDEGGLCSAPARDFAAPEVWSVVYTADALPSASNPVWTMFADGGSESYSHIEPGGVLHVLDNSADWGTKIRWYRNWSAVSATGETVLTRAKCESAAVVNEYTSNVQLSDGARYINFAILPDKVASKGEATAVLDRTYSLDGTAWHRYRFALKGASYSCYVDEDPTPVFTGAPYSSATTNQILLGANGSTAMQSIYTDSLCYRTDGTFVPGAASDTVLSAKLKPNGGSAITLIGNVVSAAYTGYFYIQSPDGIHGLRVDKASHGLGVGQAVDVVGTMATNADGERYVSASTVTANGTGTPAVFGLACARLGGSDLAYNEANGAGQRGEAGGVGLNNVALLVRSWGQVTYVDPGGMFFVMDDGSGPVKVWTESLNEPAFEDFVIVTGVCCLDASGGNPQAAVRPRTQGDILPL